MIDRRRFLGLAGGSAAILGLRPGDGRTADDEIERARALGKPLLVLLRRGDEELDRRLGRLFGELMRYGTFAQLAPLALCEVAVLDLGQVARLRDRRLPGDTFALLVETDGHGTRPLTWSEWSPRVSGRVDRAPVVALAEVLREALGVDDPETLQRRQAQLYGCLGERVMAGIDRFDPAARPRLADVDASAAVVWVWSTQPGAAGEPWTERLARAVLLRLYERAPAGGRWAADPVPAQRPDPCPPCGMAHTPAPSRTFLDLYTR